MARRHAASASPYEAEAGFSRAVRSGDHVAVAGTAPIWPDGSCPADAGLQAVQCLAIIARALADVGGEPRHVIRTRIFVTDAADFPAVARAHAAVFGEALPAATCVVVAALLDPRWKVEIEADAIVDD